MPKETNKKQNNKVQDNKKQGKEKKQKHFFKDFKAELKRVIWPTPKQLFNNTVAVITVVLITAAIVFVLDFAFESMNKYGIDKLKQLVDTTNTVQEDSDDVNSTDTNDVSNNELTNETSNETTNEVANETVEDNANETNDENAD